MDIVWWTANVIVPFAVASTITIAWVVGKHTRKRVFGLLRSVGHGLADAAHDILSTLGWVREPVRPPTLADLINERKKLRFMEFAEWDADFKRLLPPEPPRPQQGHDPDCRGMVEVEEYNELRSDFGHVAHVYQGYCRICKWSGWITEDQAQGYSDDWDIRPGRVVEIDYRKKIREEKARAWSAMKAARYAPGTIYPDGYLEFKEDVRALGLSPDPQTLATLQRQAAEAGLYEGPTDGVIGQKSMEAIIAFLEAPGRRRA